MIVINGKIYSGTNVLIVNGRVIIDGKEQSDEVSGVVEIQITEGILQNLTTDASVTCQNVAGNIKASGSISARNVMGSVSAGGSVNCGDVGGTVFAGGSVNNTR